MSPRIRFGSGLASSTPIWWTLAGLCATRPLLIAASSLRALTGARSTSVALADVTSPPRPRLTLSNSYRLLAGLPFGCRPTGQPLCRVRRAPGGENGHVQEDRLGPATLDVSPQEIGDLRPIVAAGIYLPVEEVLCELIFVGRLRTRRGYHPIPVEPAVRDAATVARRRAPSSTWPIAGTAPSHRVRLSRLTMRADLGRAHGLLGEGMYHTTRLASSRAGCRPPPCRTGPSHRDPPLHPQPWTGVDRPL